MTEYFYNPKTFEHDIELLANMIPPKKYAYIYGVPRGGCIVATALSFKLGIPLIDDQLTKDTLVVDDIIDSWTTRYKYNEYDFACLHIKSNKDPRIEVDLYTSMVNSKTFFTTTTAINKKDWINYFWEADETPAEDAVIRLIEMIGEDPNREGLKDTPKRVIKAWQEMTSGYNQDVENIVTTFNEEVYDEIVLLKDIEFYSMCEHHMLPFFGKAHVAYIPDKSLIGVSKLARIVNVFSRRLQIQERLSNQITKAINETINPKGSACIIEAQHLCMTMRGVQKQKSVMTTSSLTGIFLTQPSSKQELMRLIK